jgi:hypothetical protein
LNIRLENQTRIFFSGFSLLGAKLSALTSLPRYSKISHWYHRLTSSRNTPSTRCEISLPHSDPFPRWFPFLT